MTGFDLRGVFGAIGARLMADFKRTSQIAHSGGKGSTREEAVREFLGDHLPGRYSLGQGEFLHWSNKRSRQCDVVIYDGLRCPRLLVDDEHSVFPLESVFGTVEVKSVLTAKELEGAFENIASVKRLVPAGAIAVGIPGIAMGMPRPIPFGAVFAYSADRSLQAILDQFAALEKDGPGPMFSPDVVLVLGEGLVSRDGTRRSSNSFDEGRLGRPPVARRSGSHSLLRFYLELIQGLNSISLEDLDLTRYLRMPIVVGQHRVRLDASILKYAGDGSVERVLRFTASGIRKIVEYCRDRAPQTLQQIMSSLVSGPVEFPAGGGDAEYRVYNPNNRKLQDGGPLAALQIDDVDYQVDFAALDHETDLEEDPDPDLSELFSQVPSDAIPRRPRRRP
jgi:hypothetical protein